MSAEKGSLSEQFATPYEPPRDQIKDDPIIGRPTTPDDCTQDYASPEGAQVRANIDRQVRR